MANYIGIDIGGTAIKYGLITGGGEFLHRGSVPTEVVTKGVPQFLEKLVAIVKGYQQGRDKAVEELRTSPANPEVLAWAEPLKGVGIATAGVVDPGTGKILFASASFTGYEGTNLKKIIEQRCLFPCTVENDVNAAALGEFWQGAGRGARSLFCITVGTGIGGGLILNNALYRGRYGSAAEIGHLTMVPHGRACGCGQRGCWEQYASGNALVRTARELASDQREEASILLGLGDGTPEGVQGGEVTEAAKLGCPVSLETFAIIGDWLGRGIADLAAVLDPETFVIGGGVSEAGDLLFVPTRAAFMDHLSGAEQRPKPQLLLAEMGNDAGIAGAADLARH